MGDSITWNGVYHPAGYVNLVESALAQAGRKIVVIPAGVAGDASTDMLARLDRDVLSKKPDWMTLSCGVNDVWKKNVPLEDYKKNVTAIVDQATAAGTKVIILTSTMIEEDPSSAMNQKLAAYNDFLRSLATERHLPLADLNADMQAALAEQKAQVPGMKGLLLTYDGVHVNGLGDQVMASGILKAMGLTDAQLAQAKASWMDLPNAMEMTFRLRFSVSDYLKLRALANSENHTVDELLGETLQKELPHLLNSQVPDNTSSQTSPAKPQ